MDDKLKQYCDLLKEEATTAETHLALICQHLISPELTPIADWKSLLQEATAHCREKHERARQAGERVKVWMEELEKGEKAPFDYGNLDREITKAEDLADREAVLSLDAMVVATHAILQAEVAILKAFNTRKLAFDLARYRDVR
jgi:hypothetical protein